MADQEGEDENKRNSNPLRRERAPTITIDTSAVSPSDVSFDPQDTDRVNRIPSLKSRTSSEAPFLSSSSSPEIRPRHSAELRDRDPRPTSPHNYSSPTSKLTEAHANFLSVPGTRSRVNSLESEGSYSGSFSGSLGGETAVQSTSSPTERPSPEYSRSSNNNDIINNKDALKADPGEEQNFEVENNKFAFSIGILNKLVNPKSLGAFYAVGGLSGLEKGLRTDRQSGLNVDEALLDGTISFDQAVKGVTEDQPTQSMARASTSRSTIGSRKESDDSFSDRIRIFGTNRLPTRKAKSIWELAWIAYNDKVLLLLSVAAVISLALGIYQSVTSTDGEARVQWVEGVAIIVAILIVVVVGAANDWQKERQFVKLNEKKEERLVKVVRSGRTMEISIYDVLVGDVMLLEPGDLIPVDGILVEGHNVKCDESSITGESVLVQKQAANHVYRVIENHENTSRLDPFMISGAKVSEGVGKFLVIAVGPNSVHGKTLLSLHDEGQTTPLQFKLNVLAEYIAKLGLAAGLLLFVVLFIKFLVQLGKYDTADEKGQAFLQIFIVAVTIIVVAVPEGLPLAVTLALAFATTRMLRDNNLVRLLRACETMGNATTICSDKTGTLTQNRMTVVAGALGPAFRFGTSSSSHSEHSETQEQRNDSSDDVPPAEFIATISTQVKDLLKQSIVQNSTAFEGEEDGVPAFIGSKTETALLSFARDHLGLGSVSEERSNAEVVQMVPFDSSRKCMAVVIHQPSGQYRMFVKGAAEILISKSTKILNDPKNDPSETTLTEDSRSTLNQVVSNYASQSLRTIALLYRDFDQWPPRGAPVQEDDRDLVQFDAVFKDMVFLAVVGIQDPLRPGVTDSVHQCQKAGVFVRMVTGDNIMTAKAIAQKCGIFTPGGIAMEGPQFRKMSSRQMVQIIPRLQILARSSPNDKKVLVAHLKQMGETVAVTGDGTNDAAALKTADVGFSMGISGTEVAKEASDIILMDDNFTSIVKAMAWGRTVNDAVKKFLQFQITVNITAVVLTFVSAVASESETSVLTAVQLLWVNLIMDTFAALALATDPPPAHILDRSPDPKSSPLITSTMWKMIIGQAIYQLVVTLILNFAGASIFNYTDASQLAQLQTTVFNTFVWMQVFNQYNCRRIDNHLNMFEGIHRNKWFIGIQMIIIAGQVLIIFVGGKAFSVTRLDGSQWGISLVLGVLSLPVAVVIRLIPDGIISRLIPSFWPRRKQGPQVFVSDEERRFEWNPALEEIRDQLSFLKTVRGGRLKQLKHKLAHPETLLPRSRSGSRSQEDSIPATPNGGENGGASPPPATPESRSRNRARSRSNSAFGPAAAMAGIIAGSVAGWSPIDRNSVEAGSIKISRNSPHAGLDHQPGIELHPDTRPDDPIIGDYDASSQTPPSQNPELAPFFEYGPPDRAPSRGRRSTVSRRSGSFTNASQQ